MIYLALILILMQLFDFYSTFVILRAGGREVNPVVNFLINKIGLVLALIIAKSVAIAGVVFIYYVDNLIAMIVLILIYSYVCLNNYKVMKRGS